MQNSNSTYLNSVIGSDLKPLILTAIYLFFGQLGLAFSFSTFSYFSCDSLLYQEPRLTLTAGQELVADVALLDDQGWTHYVNCQENKLLLSIYTNGQNLGAISEGLIIRSGLSSNYGNGAIDLSNADYIDNDLWFAANRYWQIENAQPLESGEEIKIRFYYNQTDLADIAQTMEEYGLVIDEPEDLYLYTITGNSLHPYSEIVRDNDGIFRLLQSGEETSTLDYISGSTHDLYYGELSATTSEISGGLGLLLFLPDDPLTISGNIDATNNLGIENVTVKCENGTSGTTNTLGQFDCTDIAAGADYELVPEKNIFPDENVTVLDINRLYQHINEIEPLTNPYYLIAADATNSTTYEEADIKEIEQIILHNKLQYSNNSSWRFIPETYQFPNVHNPFEEVFPEFIRIENILNDVGNQNFKGIKIGDVAQEVNYTTEDSTITAPHFYLKDVNLACGVESNVSMDLKVEDFTGIGGFQFTIEWDPTKLTFTGIDNFNLAFLNGANFGLREVNSGKITVLWTSYPLITQGLSLTEEMTIASLHFRPLVNTNSATTVRLNDAIIPNQVIRGNFQITQAKFSSGQVLFGDNPVSIFSVVESIQCHGDQNGKIQLTLTPPDDYTFNWNNGAITSTIDQLEAGNYSVTVNEESDCPIILENFAITEPEMLHLSTNVQDITCKGANDGSISTSILGGMPPFDFSWNNTNLPILHQDNLSSGVYIFSAHDVNGCEAMEMFILEEPRALAAAVEIQNSTAANMDNGSIEVVEVYFGQAPFTYEWSTGSNENAISQLMPGNYTLTITDANNCSNFFAYEVDFRTAINNNLKHDIWNIFPNPIEGGQWLQIELPTSLQNEKWQAQLFHSNGQLITKNSLNNRQLKSPLTKGVYILVLTTDTKRLIERIIVE